ncbi:hypothetical protein HIM_08613 [Hirsutella minnesotensis 3608]|uniref:Vesicle tethering protein Uso1/P115-like head domain-containing protein n=1 Tax=Hirsutella minnesotensis 3608 TaxID=1043627 RepID=A0A0F7ZY89_9HYPO|nr:hypothetical protein HIM_08613 [Hirsutella minnesotensis 3608]
MFSIATAPAKQSVSDTISVLSARLSSATLLEDRRAAILGLRSFAKDFPASVASGALRSLIGCLADDGDDVDTVKVVLETLLMLFNPNDDSPEASDEIVLWLADEFTQHQANILQLLKFVESPDFYSRLYSLQLLAAILSARAQRTEECVLNATLGISRLVAVLDDSRDAIRDEAITLLTGLTPTSVELQKLVAFENAFERIFSIIDNEGSLAEGSRAVEDCLILLANLLRRNGSNQSLFRESGCMKALSSLMQNALIAQDAEGNVAAWAQVQQNRNMYAFLGVIRLFLQTDAAGATQNQLAFWKHGLVYHVLQLAFNNDVGHLPLRAEALLTCGDMIRGVQPLQEGFAQLTVASPLSPAGDNAEKPDGDRLVYVIDGLLDLVLNVRDQPIFDLRFAACECLKSYFTNHSEVKLHFLSRAIDGYQEESDDSANVLTVLMRPESVAAVNDPYRSWFASVIVFHLLHENPPAKARALGLSEGDSDKGEEVVTSIQTIAAHLISGMSREDDSRSLVGYMMLLASWMFEDLDAVNDFLAEGSNLQGLIQSVSRPHSPGTELVQGLSAMLLGVVYEFSTKDSPIPRTKLHEILTTRPGRQEYVDQLKCLRRHPLMRDFEVTAQRFEPATLSGLPDVFFDATFVEFFKDSYSRVLRAIDRSPDLEASVVLDGVQVGVSRELVESLRHQLEDKDRFLQGTLKKAESLEQQLRHELESHQRANEEAAVQLARAKSACETLQRSQETEIRKLQGSHSVKEIDLERQIASLRDDVATKEATFQRGIQAQQAALADSDAARVRAEAAASGLRTRLAELEATLSKAHKDKEEELRACRAEHDRNLEDCVQKYNSAEERNCELQSQIDQAKQTNKSLTMNADRRCREMESQIEQAQHALQQMKAKCERVESERAAATKAKDAAQSELDDLLIVFGDLEEKIARYKTRLRDLGEAISDGEDDDGLPASDDDDG